MNWSLLVFVIRDIMVVPRTKERRIISVIILIGIYTLSDLGDLSNLIGSLSRTIQQYSPPSEWIMCERPFFPPFS